MKEIAEILVKNNIIQTNFVTPFTWTSGIKSPIYCDCRELISVPEARTIIIESFIEEIKKSIPDQSLIYIAGTATAGIPWAAFVAEEMNQPMLYVRSKPKGHGAGKMVEGRAQDDQVMIVVEDAFSTAGSSIKSVEALRNEYNAHIDHVFGIFSWDTPAAVENATKGKVRLHPLTNFSEIVDSLHKHGRISDSEKESLISFHQDPAEWHS